MPYCANFIGTGRAALKVTYSLKRPKATKKGTFFAASLSDAWEKIYECFGHFQIHFQIFFNVRKKVPNGH